VATVTILFGASLVVRWWYLAMNWFEGRARRQMLRGVARWKLEQRKSRSRTSGGFTSSDVGRPPGLRPRVGRPGLSAPPDAPPVCPELSRSRLSEGGSEMSGFTDGPDGVDARRDPVALPHSPVGATPVRCAHRVSSLVDTPDHPSGVSTNRPPLSPVGAGWTDPPPPPAPTGLQRVTVHG
jgi:hypothetical protein